MKHLLPALIAIPLILAGCTAAVTPVTPSNLYHGYPCGNECASFRTGYETAQNRRYTGETQCNGLPSNLRLGCKSYLHEYEITVGQPGGYVFAGRTSDLR